MESNVKDEFVYKQPKTFEERRKLAQILPERLKFRMPLAVDPIDGRADKAYAAWPERIYVIGTDGRLVYKADPGPFGFKPEEAEKGLQRLLSGSRPRT
jgi:hypothetical protein